MVFFATDLRCHNDLYRPVEAIDEAYQGLRLFPYRRASGEAVLDAGHDGDMSVNNGLDFFSLPEWSLYYAQKAVFITPYRNKSHIAVALAYDELGLKTVIFLLFFTLFLIMLNQLYVRKSNVGRQ